MKEFYIIMLLCFLAFTAQSSDQKIGHAFISNWKPGSYGSPNVRRERKPLPVYVWIEFSPKVIDTTANQILDFIVQSIQPLDHSARYQAMKNQPGYYCIMIQPTTTREQLQTFIDKANKHFDPTFQTTQEIEILKIQADLQQKEAAFSEQQRIAIEDKLRLEESKRKVAEEKRKLDEERNRINAEKRKLAEDKIKEQKEAAQSKPMPLNTPQKHPIAPTNIAAAPGLAQRFQHATGGEGYSSPAFAKQLASAQSDMESELAYIRARHKLENNRVKSQNKIGFAPIKEAALKNFSQHTAPGITERFAGNNQLESGGYLQAMNAAYGNLETELAALEAKYNSQYQNINSSNYNLALYQQKSREFSQYTAPAIAEYFEGIGALDSSGFKNTLILEGRAAGLRDNDIESIISSRFGI